MKPVLIYCYDAYCGWCYGFSPVIQNVWSVYKDRLDMEVLSGGMILPETPVHIGVTASYTQKTYKQVEELTGVIFSPEYLWHIDNPDKSDWFPNSLKPAMALCIFKEIFPALQLEFAVAMQHALHAEGRDLCDDESYRHLLIQYNIQPKEFYSKLHSEEYKEKAYYEFALVKQLSVTGYPCIFLQTAESKLFLLARGYVPFANLVEKLNLVLKEINFEQP